MCKPLPHDALPSIVSSFTEYMSHLLKWKVSILGVNTMSQMSQGGCRYCRSTGLEEMFEDWVVIESI